MNLGCCLIGCWHTADVCRETATCRSLDKIHGMENEAMTYSMRRELEDESHGVEMGIEECER